MSIAVFSVQFWWPGYYNYLDLGSIMIIVIVIIITYIYSTFVMVLIMYAKKN